MPNDEDAVFCIRIEYEIGTPDPGRVFRSMASLIGSFSVLDRVLAESVGLKAAPTLLLEDIATGSLRTWLRNRLDELPDEAVQELSWRKAIGSYVVRGKRRLMQALGDRPEVNTRDDITHIQNVVREAADDAGVTRLPIYTPPSPERIIRAASDISDALANLGAGDSASYLSDEGDVAIRGLVGVTTDKIESLLTRETVTSTVEMVLKVKKPDYLGASMWEFRHGEHPVSGRIDDSGWLRRFQSREIDVRPGDSLRARVRTDVRYGYHSEVIAVRYTILAVLGTVQQVDVEQLPLPPMLPPRP